MIYNHINITEIIQRLILIVNFYINISYRRFNFVLQWYYNIRFFREKSKKRAKKFDFSEIVPLYLQYLILDNLYDLIII